MIGTSVSQNMEEELDEIFLASFPIKNEDEFTSVELQLQNDKTFVVKLVNNLIHHIK